jgi:hypothetical protein
LGVEKPTLFTALRVHLAAKRDELWRERVKDMNYRLFDDAVTAYNWFCVEELTGESAEWGGGGGGREKDPLRTP